MRGGASSSNVASKVRYCVERCDDVAGRWGDVGTVVKDAVAIRLRILLRHSSRTLSVASFSRANNRSSRFPAVGAWRDGARACICRRAVKTFFGEKQNAQSQTVRAVVDALLCSRFFCVCVSSYELYFAFFFVESAN